MGACTVGVIVKKWIFILLLLIGLLVACDSGDDCPVCPPLIPVSDYNFYISDVLRDNYIFVYNTAAQAITDSIPKGDRSTEYIAVTIDEKHLLLSTLEYGLTWVLDIESRQQIDQFDYGGELAVSADGRYIAIQGDSLRILNA
ncbi:MAG: hypothetical protein KAT79_04480, partial [candidate division Zixibacteria bacterium]|nr:hypothetical protein [candidate division Zixibacteria bacterium]